MIQNLLASFRDLPHPIQIALVGYIGAVCAALIIIGKSVHLIIGINREKDRL